MRRPLLLVGALAVVVLSGCGIGGVGGSAPTAQTTGVSDTEILAVGKQVAQCMRDHGVPDLPDPVVEDGHLKLPEGVEEQMEARHPRSVLEQAQEACQHLLDRLPESALREDDSDSEGQPGPGDVEALRQFAACMRQHGVPDWPDPNPDGSFPMTPRIAREGKSAANRAAYEACSKFWSGSISFARPST